ncbi:NAD-dependent DNA ligase LigA [Candidatus Azambacteria bacterium]|nr:NAD-dependent DNA ligase LigA [Candidatus Azambacteria bacterium]
MSLKEIKIRIQKLREEINHHRYLYHVLDRQEISDAALDSLKHELGQWEKEYPEFITSDSPTQRVGGQPLDKFVKVNHQSPMLSLNDVFSQQELIDWEKRNIKIIPGSYNYFGELKIDGFAVSLIYKNGIFHSGSTRGDGLVGEDVAQNLKTIESIPLKLTILSKKEYQDNGIESGVYKNLVSKIEEGEIEIRGEVYLTKDDFELINQEQKEKGLDLFANPRNIAAGSIRQLDSRLVTARHLNFLAYALVTDLGQTTHREEHQILRLIGFKTDNFAKVVNNKEEINLFWRDIMSHRDKLPYQIDGLVININDNQIFRNLGVVGKAPRGAIAYKFPAEEVTTIVEDIIIQVGRTGVLTPVACLRPVMINGALISRATLHNEDEIKRLELKVGDTVIVVRAGDVIPSVIKVLKNLRSGHEKEFVMPQKCPNCFQRIVKPEGEVNYRCLNKDCSAIQKEQIYHFVSKKAFNIVGLGPKIIDHFYDLGLIKDASDIFYLKKEDLEPLERFAEKSADNIIASIENSKKISLSRFIYALGIFHVGEETAIDLANYFNSLKKIQRASFDEINALPDIGPVIAQSIHFWFQDEVNQKFLSRLFLAGIEIENPILHPTNYKLQTKLFVLTGELESLSRDQAKEKIRALGGEISESVSKKTNYVVVGKNPGSKYTQAQKLNIKILNEEEFLKMSTD